ncbi:MAG: CpaD family pilus assembly protein [Caulobacteraceae bacterium]
MTSKILPALLILSAAASLGACTSTSDIQARTPNPVTPTAQYKVDVRQAPQDIALAVHPQGLSPNQQSALVAFVSGWTDNGGGDLVVKSPVNGGDPSQARLTADATMSFLQHLGVPAERLRLEGYDAQHAPKAPVIASYAKYEAVVADCAHNWGNLTSTRDNRPQANFGCAETSNIAAMVANPRDLVTPTASDPADNSRRQVVLGKYRQGATTSTAQDSQASGKASDSQ